MTNRANRADDRDVNRVPNRVLLGDCLEVLPTLADGAFGLIYLDPPFNTGRDQSMARMTARRSEGGDRSGFQGRRYET